MRLGNNLNMNILISVYIQKTDYFGHTNRINLVKIDPSLIVQNLQMYHLLIDSYLIQQTRFIYLMS